MEAATSGKSFARPAGRGRARPQASRRKPDRALLDPTAYTGQCAQLATEQAARARKLAAALGAAG